MNKLTIALALGCAAACGKKAPGSDAGATATVTPAAPAGSAARTDATTAAPQNAAGGEVGSARLVNDCPKSLSGGEEVARTIKKECGPIAVTGDYTVDGSLTLEAGVVLKVAEGASISVGYNKPAKLIVKGTAAEPVTLTAAGDQVPGFWSGVRLYSQANRSQIDGLVIEYAGKDDKGALDIEAVDVTVKNTTIRNAKEVGLRIDNDARVTELSGMTFDKAGSLAASVPPAALGAMTPGKFDAGAVIQVRQGTVDADAKWQNVGAPYVFTNGASIEGKNGKATVTVAAGTELRFGDDAELSVGYNSAGALVVAGTADKPVVFTSGGEKTAGVWKGIVAYTSGELRLEGAVVEHGGKYENRGAIFVQDSGQITLKGSTIRTNVIGLDLQDGAKVREIAGNTFSGNTTSSVVLSASQVGALAADNKLEKEKVTVKGGTLKETATWNALGAVVEVTEDMAVDGRATLTLAPGLDLAFKSGVELSVAYGETAGLKAVGTADKPIHLHGITADPGSWDGVVLYDQARDVDLEHVILEGTGGDAAVRVKDGVTGKIANVTCRKCAEAAVLSACKSKVEVGEIKAEDGTPAGAKKAEGCE